MSESTTDTIRSSFVHARPIGARVDFLFRVRLQIVQIGVNRLEFGIKISHVDTLQITVN